MHSIVRRTLSLSLLAALALFASGCGNDPKPPPVGLTQAEADDLMQVLASMAAIDNGGWMTAYDATLQAHPRSNLPAPGPLSVATFGSIASRDTSFTRGNMAWSFSYVYYDTLNAARSSWDPSVRYLEAACHTQGLMTIQDFNGTTGSGRYAYTDTLLCDGYRDTSVTLNFHGLSVVDSALITLTSGTASRFYYFDNLVDVNAEMPKDEAQTFPRSGEVRIDTFVDVLNSASRNDKNHILDAVGTIAFDGTQTPRATITMNTDPATEVFRYTIDLKTGQIARAP